MIQKSFTLAIKEFMAQTKEDHRNMTARAGMELARRVILKTPVDTGRARGSFMATIGAPASGQSGLIDPTGQNAIAAAISTYSRAPAFSNLWLTSNLEYILDLEYGSSRQAPQGMVRVSIAELESLFK